jgi:hypothetical protein
MMDKETVEKYFDLMKSRGVIADYWIFDSYREEVEYIKIYYLHKSGKKSSYRFLTERVLQELRDDKLRKLFD